MKIAKYKKNAKSFLKYIEFIKRDYLNKLRYGWQAPRHLERIWVNPMEIDEFITGDEIKRISGLSRQEASGVIIDWDLIQNVESLHNDFRFRYSFGRWAEDKTWSELGVYEYMKNETIKYRNMSQEQLEQRYRNFDKLFHKIKSDGRLKTRKEINKMNFREKDGILIHVGKNGKLYFGGIGFHRFSIAKILKLEKIPACIGVVAKDAINTLRKMRH